MRASAKMVALSLLALSGCFGSQCSFDCSENGDEDCVANNNQPTGIPSAPPAPLTLACRSLNSQPETELEWQLTIGGGTAPFTYTLDFGDHTPVHTASWFGGGSDPRGYHDYEHGGDFQVGGQVRDAAGQTQSCALVYSAPDPDLNLRCDVTPLTGTAPLTATFDVSNRTGCVGPCTVTWYFGDGDTYEGGHVVHTYEFPGPSSQNTYAAFAELRDSTDRVARCRRPVQVLPRTGLPPPSTNHAPSIGGLLASPSTITAGHTSTLSGTTSDPDPGDVVTWQLTFDSSGNVGTLSPTSGTGAILSTYTSSPSINQTATVSIRVTAVDSQGAQAPYGSIVVNVAGSPLNHPPTILSLTATPATIFLGGQPTQLGATATDPDGDPLTWAVTLDSSSAVNGTFTPLSGTGAISATFSPTSTPNNTGTAVIRLNVADPSGATDTRTVNVNVVLGKQ